MMNVFGGGVDERGGRRMPSRMAALILGVLLGTVAGCATDYDRAPPPADSRPPATVSGSVPPAASTSTAITSAPRAVLQRPRARWVSADWSELPGWDADTIVDWWPALLRGCDKPVAEWARVCSEARAMASLSAVSDATLRDWIRKRLQAWRVEGSDGINEGLITGYFEPLVEARRTPNATFRIPLYGPPADLQTRKPYWTRQQLDTSATAQAALRGRVLAYVADPLDALILQIQGSGRLQLTEANGQRKLLRVAYAGHNDHPYKSVGKWLIEQGELRTDQASWPAIKTWAQKNPKRLNEMLWSNPRVVFFREEPLPDPSQGPRGAQGVALTPGRSIAVDAQSIPYGTPVWLDSTEPLSNAPLRRLVMAQDTGSAIVGAVRADYFWGWGDAAEQQAGRMKQPLRLWVLWPRS
jgi:membrane-bound lytic murein transglycosylase A